MSGLVGYDSSDDDEDDTKGVEAVNARVMISVPEKIYL